MQSNNSQRIYESEDYRDRTARNVLTDATGFAPNIFNVRSSWTGRRVVMKRRNGEWLPVDGRFEKVTMPKLGSVNVLCHDTDCKPPKGYKIGE